VSKELADRQASQEQAVFKVRLGSWALLAQLALLELTELAAFRELAVPQVLLALLEFRVQVAQPV
jgi:hypothetical protein